MSLLLVISGMQCAFAQDTAYSRKVIETLCSNKYHGRGYTHNGAIKASKYIAKQMKKAGLKPPSGTYLQYFQMKTNTLTVASIQGPNYEQWVPGVDFQIAADAPNYLGPIGVKPDALVNAELLSDSLQFESQRTAWYMRGDRWVVIDTMDAAKVKKYQKQLSALGQQFHTLRFTNSKFTWTVSPIHTQFVDIELHYSSKVYIEVLEQCKLHIGSQIIQSFQRNVVGWIPGTEKPDSFIMITAHYDHLGEMGEAIFRGANDNAAGVAMMLDLARHYSKNPARYSMVFVAFAGEEAGLIGSGYYVQHPRFPLNKTRFLLNLDLVGTGETGMTVVNATAFPTEFSILDSLNKVGKYVPNIAKRGKAANSDHYWFTEAGVHSFFWYQSGPRSSYHDIYDVPQTLTLAGYIGTYQLAMRFFNQICGNELLHETE